MDRMTGPLAGRWCRMPSPEPERQSPPPTSGRGSWLDALAAWRDRRVADRSFQRWAAGFWLTRPLARRRAAQLFDLMAGFVYSQVLAACVRVDLFDLLARDGPQAVDPLAARCGMSSRAMRRLLDAAVSVRLLRRRSDGRIALGPLGAPMVGNAPLKAMVEHHAALYADLRDPVALLREEGAGSAMSAYWPYAAYEAPGALSEQRVAEYSALMTASQPTVIDEVLDAYDFSRHRRMLDVGGGEGRFVAEVAARHPHLALTLFDLPSVTTLASRRLEGLGLGARVRTVGGSFFDDPLPAGADLLTLVRVLFDHDDDHALAILRAARAALAPGGTVLVAEPMARAPGAHPGGDAYFGFYLLAMGRGQSRSVDAMAALLRAAGFVAVRPVRTRLPLQAAIVAATA